MMIVDPFEFENLVPITDDLRNAAQEYFCFANEEKLPPKEIALWLMNAKITSSTQVGDEEEEAYNTYIGAAFGVNGFACRVLDGDDEGEYRLILADDSLNKLIRLLNALIDAINIRRGTK